MANAASASALLFFCFLFFSGRGVVVFKVMEERDILSLGKVCPLASPSPPLPTSSFFSFSGLPPLLWAYSPWLSTRSEIGCAEALTHLAMVGDADEMTSVM